MYKPPQVYVKSGLSAIFKRYNFNSVVNLPMENDKFGDGCVGEENRVSEFDGSFPIQGDELEPVAMDEDVKFDVNKAVEVDKEKVRNFFDQAAPQYLSTRQWDRQESLRTKKFILIDLSGTLHIEDTETPDAIIALERLKIAGFKVLFVTNTTKESKRILHERVCRIGFRIKKEEIFTSLNASRVYIEKRGLRPFFMIADEAMEDFEGVNVENPNTVLVGLSSKDFNHETLNKAFRLLAEKDTTLLAIHKGRTYRTSSGISIGPGAFVVALECSSEKTAIIMGKPDQAFFKSALDFIGCENVEEAVMIGDDVFDDVLGAMMSGITGILVQTGKYNVYDEKKILPHAPDFKVKNFGEAVELVLEAVADGMGLKPNLSADVLARSIQEQRHRM